MPVTNLNTNDWTNSITPLLTPSQMQYDVFTKLQTVAVRDYQHASRIFVDGNFRLSPKYGFLFYVEFDFNPLISSVSNTSAQELGMIVKNVTLPKFSIDTKVHNAYNRKNIVQNKINYDPVTITFHDDQSDNVRNFWYDYYSFFYRDSDYADATYQLISKYQERPTFEWGYTPKPVGSYNSPNAYQNYQYIQAIRIYSLYQKNFSEYELVNPIITSFKHGDHNTSDNQGLMEHQMSIQFETVKYQTGYTTNNTVGGYIDLHYDNTPSPLASAVGASAVGNGQGGYTTANDRVTDLASFNMTTNSGSVVPPILGIQNSLATAATTMATAAQAATATTNNAGGFALPALGSTSTGVTNSSLISGQLNQAGQQIGAQAGTAIGAGVASGIANGLGQNGTAVLGIAAAAISNPSAALATVENMALKFVTGAALATTNALATAGGQYLSQQISSGVSAINHSLSYGDTPNGTLTGDLAKSFSGVKESVQNFFDPTFTSATDPSSLNAVNGSDLASDTARNTATLFNQNTLQGTYTPLSVADLNTGAGDFLTVKGLDSSISGVSLNSGIPPWPPVP